MSLAQLRKIERSFANGVKALGPLDLDIGEGEFVSLLGPSGCGKSTALRVIAGLLHPSAGELHWPHGRPRLGFVFQDPTLMPWADARANVRLPLDLARMSRHEADTRADAALARVGLAGFAGAFPRELSGGMRMRVSIARALVAEPQLLLMDEPFAALDEMTRQELNDDLLTLWRDDKLTVVFVTHSVYESTYLSTRTVVLSPRPGRVAADIALSRSPKPDHAYRFTPQFAADAAKVGAALKNRGEGRRMTQALKYILPLGLGLAVLALWEFLVRLYDVPRFLLPAPTAIWDAFISDAPSWLASVWTTLSITLIAFALSAVTSVGLAILFSQSRIVEMMLYPYAVVLQVTPVVAIAPLIVIWVGFDRINLALLILAWIVAFFPILSNTTLGLRSTDYNLIDLFKLYGASNWQILTRLKLPSALPYLLSGLKTSGGLSLIGTVVAEYGAGSGTATGLAWRVIESGNRLRIDRMFVGLSLLAALGIAIFFSLSLLEHMILRKWHESAAEKEN